MKRFDKIYHQLQKAYRELPSLLKIILSISLAFTLITIIGILSTLVTSIIVGKAYINGNEVSPWEAFNYGWPFFLGIIVWGFVHGIIAYSLWFQRTWAREAIIAFNVFIPILFVLAVIFIPISPDLIVILFLIILLMFSAWYLYFKSNVVNYFDSLEEQNTINNGAA